MRVVPHFVYKGEIFLQYFHLFSLQYQKEEDRPYDAWTVAPEVRLRYHHCLSRNFMSSECFPRMFEQVEH